MNNCKLFVGNLTYSVREGQLQTLFSQFGEVISVRILEKKGYGFVEMKTPQQAQSAREALSETEFEGRNLLIDGVRPFIKPKKSPFKSNSGGQRGRPDSRSGSRPGTRPGYKPGGVSSNYRGKKPNPSSGQRPSGSGYRPSSPSRSPMPARRGSGSRPRRS